MWWGWDGESFQTAIPKNLPSSAGSKKGEVNVLSVVMAIAVLPRDGSDPFVQRETMLTSVQGQAAKGLVPK